jgi:DNA-directed RNA polymerase specialized sigma24 family protein
MFTKVVDETVVNQYWPIVNRIASDYARKFRSVQRDDIVQELWVWFLTHPGKVKEWMAYPLKDGDKLFARSLRNAAMTFCVKEKARVEGYHVDDLFWYSKDFIKELLPAVLSEDWKRIQESFESGGGGTPKPPNESGDWMAYASDIRKAYDSLDEDDRKLVDVNDVHGSVLMEETQRPTIRAAEMAANRAVGKMVKFLGGERPRLRGEPDVVVIEEEPNQEEEEE